jgi:hypothetical protein
MKPRGENVPGSSPTSSSQILTMKEWGVDSGISMPTLRRQRAKMLLHHPYQVRAVDGVDRYNSSRVRATSVLRLLPRLTLKIFEKGVGRLVGERTDQRFIVSIPSSTALTSRPTRFCSAARTNWRRLRRLRTSGRAVDGAEGVNVVPAS